MDKRTLASVAALALVATTAVQSQPVTLSAGTPFSRAHAQMVAIGYRPYRPLKPGSELYHRNIFNRDDVYRLYPDVVNCAGSANADCLFVLSRTPADIIIAHTVGEHANTLTFQDFRHVTQVQADALYR